ncbi:MAG: kelch repeat-containing protein, partial [Thermomicrobiales bacterium]
MSVLRLQLTRWPRRRALAAGLALAASALARPVAGRSPDAIQPGPLLLHPRAAHTATLLPDGRVLLAGGCTADSCDLSVDGATSELFDPISGEITPGPDMAQPRVSH